MKFRYASIPYLIWSAVFVLVPLGLVAVFAFTTQDGTFTIDNIARVSSYTPVFMRSVWLAILATAICLCIGYPLAYLMSRMSGVSQRTMVMLIMLPMWINFLLRTYAWMTLLENNGVINTVLRALGFGTVRMINTQGAVVLGMVYNYLPFMILPLYSIMTKIDDHTVFSRVIFPLSVPGISTGVTMVFVPAISTFIISRMLGGGSNMLIGDLIDAQFLGNAYNPNLGAAISMVLMVFILLVMSIFNQFDDSEEREGMLI